MTALPAWTTDLELGVPEIDEQHRMLWEMIVELARYIGQDQPLQGALDTIQGMEAYAAYHFTEEQALMEAAGWPGSIGHQDQHAAFLAKAGEFAGKARVDGNQAALEILGYLLRWLADHIRIRDREFFRSQS